jgi:effector-binding domain-containing protein
MNYSVRIASVPEQLIAASRRRTTLKRVSQEIQRLLEAPWAFIRQNPDLRRDGHNVALYRNEPIGTSVEVGIQIVRAFEPTDLVVCSSTPAGTVAMTSHFGPYSALGGAHSAVHLWCKENGRVLAGVYWEIYGDWTDDPAKLQTDVLYLLT